MLTPGTLRAIRHMQRMTQAELSKRAGVSQVAIATFETSKTDMRASSIRKLMTALDVKVEWIIGDMRISGP